MAGQKDIKHLAGIKSGLETYAISFGRIQHLPGRIQEQTWEDIRSVQRIRVKADAAGQAL